MYLRSIIKYNCNQCKQALYLRSMFQGSTIRLQNISGQTITLHRDNIPSGVYFSRLVQNNILIATRKLVITD